VDAPIAGVVTKYTYYPDGQVNTAARQVSAGPPATSETTTYTYRLVYFVFPASSVALVAGPVQPEST